MAAGVPPAPYPEDWFRGFNNKVHSSMHRCIGPLKNPHPAVPSRGESVGSAHAEAVLQVRYLCRQDVFLCGVTLASLELEPEILELEPWVVDAVLVEQINEAGISNGVHELSSEVNKPQCTVVLRH